MTISALPSPPLITDAPDVFDTKASAHVASLSTLVTELNAAIGIVNMTKWISGTTYAIGDVTWSPADFQAYRRKTAGAGTTDPSADSTNWQRTEVSATTLQNQNATAFTTGGTSTAFTLTPTPAIAALVTNQRFRITFNAAAGATPTLSVSGLTAKNLKYKDSTGTKQAITSTQVPSGWISDVEYDGTDYVVLSVVANSISATDLQVQLATAFTTAGTSTAFTLTPTPALAALATNQRFRITFNAAAGATPTLAVSGLTAKNLKYKDSSGTKQAITSVQVPSGWISDVEYDGTDYVVLNVAGVSGIPQNSKSAAYTTVLADANTHILHPSADTTARIFTIDSNANVAYPIGTALTFVNQNAAGVITIAITTDTMRLSGAGTTGSRTLAANGIATAIKLTATEWIISGTGLT